MAGWVVARHVPPPLLWRRARGLCGPGAMGVLRKEGGWGGGGGSGESGEGVGFYLACTACMLSGVLTQRVAEHSHDGLLGEVVRSIGEIGQGNRIVLHDWWCVPGIHGACAQEPLPWNARPYPCPTLACGLGEEGQGSQAPLARSVPLCVLPTGSTPGRASLCRCCCLCCAPLVLPRAAPAATTPAACCRRKKAHNNSASSSQPKISCTGCQRQCSSSTPCPAPKWARGRPCAPTVRHHAPLAVAPPPPPLQLWGSFGGLTPHAPPLWRALPCVCRHEGGCADPRERRQGSARRWQPGPGA